LLIRGNIAGKSEFDDDGDEKHDEDDPDDEVIEGKDSREEFGDEYIVLRRMQKVGRITKILVEIPILKNGPVSPAQKHHILCL